MLKIELSSPSNSPLRNRESTKILTYSTTPSTTKHSQQHTPTTVPTNKKDWLNIAEARDAILKKETTNLPYAVGDYVVPAVNTTHHSAGTVYRIFSSYYGLPYDHGWRDGAGQLQFSVEVMQPNGHTYLCTPNYIKKV